LIESPGAVIIEGDKQFPIAIIICNIAIYNCFVEDYFIRNRKGIDSSGGILRKRDAHAGCRNKRAGSGIISSYATTAPTGRIDYIRISNSSSAGY